MERIYKPGVGLQLQSKTTKRGEEGRGGGEDAERG